MIKPASIPFSFSKILNSRKPREELITEIVQVLRKGLKNLKIVWNEKAFCAGLANSDLPNELLLKLEGYLEVATKLDWVLPVSIVEEFDRIVEDIESFNPSFRKSLGRKSR